ncbi:MAG TPA: hypothetical protein VJ654_10960 [Noviherbaspirillum sp.]|nr:hypothetical protein [Noviherbaspirillum sp.]
MTFSSTWQSIQASLRPGDNIPNWTAAKGYLGDSFRIFAVSSSAIEIDSPGADTLQRVSRKDMEFMYDRWADYCAGHVTRSTLCKYTRVSKYSMSILKYLQTNTPKHAA